MSDEKKSGLILVSVITSGLMLLALWFYNVLEYDYVEEDKGYQGEAKTNPYLAAEFFLLEMGQKVEKIKLFSTDKSVLNVDDTLMVPSIRLAFDRRRSKEILDWVERGGHLIITGQPVSERNAGKEDYILDSLGLMIETKALAENSTQYEEQIDVAIDDEDFWKIDLDDFLVITKTDKFNAQTVWRIEDEGRLHGLQILLGEGRVTLLSDMRLFKNDYINEFDHAAFLFLLSSDQYDKSSSGTFYYSLFEEQDSLFQWLWKHAALFMLSILGTVGIVLWKMMPRFGPVINVKQPVRRQFTDHIIAAGNYQWRQGNYLHLLHNVRSQLSQQLKIKKPEWSRLNKQEQLRHFSDTSGIDLDVIEAALFKTKIEKADDFIVQIKTLEQLRKSL